MKLETEDICKQSFIDLPQRRCLLKNFYRIKMERYKESEL